MYCVMGWENYNNGIRTQAPWISSQVLYSLSYLAPIFQQVDRHILPPLNDFRPRKSPPAGSFCRSYPVSSSGWSRNWFDLYLFVKKGIYKNWWYVYCIQVNIRPCFVFILSPSLSGGTNIRLGEFQFLSLS